MYFVSCEEFEGGVSKSAAIKIKIPQTIKSKFLLLIILKTNFRCHNLTLSEKLIHLATKVQVSPQL